MDKKNIIMVILSILMVGLGIYIFIDYKEIEKEDSLVTLTSKYYNTLSYVEFDKYSLDKLIDEYSKYPDDDERWTTFNNVWQEYKIKSASIINNALTSKESFIVCVYNENDNNGKILEFIDRYINENNIYIFKLEEGIYKSTALKNYVDIYPTVIIIKDGNIYSYIDDNLIYENYDNLKKWIDNYIKR